MRSRCAANSTESGKRGADILPGQAIMRLAKPLIVKHHIDAGNARARERPAFDGQPPGDRLGHGAGDQRRAVNLAAKLRRHRWRFDNANADGSDLLAGIVKAVARDHMYLMLTSGTSPKSLAKLKPECRAIGI